MLLGSHALLGLARSQVYLELSLGVGLWHSLQAPSSKVSPSKDFEISRKVKDKDITLLRHFRENDAASQEEFAGKPLRMG